MRHEANNLTSSLTDIELCRQQSFTLLYRLLFVLFAEDRKLLPYKIDRGYIATTDRLDDFAMKSPRRWTASTKERTWSFLKNRFNIGPICYRSLT